MSNLTLLNDLQIPFVTQEIQRLLIPYRQSILGHNSKLIAENSGRLTYHNPQTKKS
jgi:hypothetical protein